MAEFSYSGTAGDGAAGAVLVGSVAIGVNPITASAQAQFDVVGPAGSEAFGSDVLVLSNGNYVVADPLFDSSPTLQDVGAVYLYNGVTNQVISTITGSTTDDRSATSMATDRPSHRGRHDGQLRDRQSRVGQRWHRSMPAR